ncbi:MAG: Fic family protein [Bacilli bacterium]|nr:Fic family protein [Bacilli bacterium]MDD4795083.1 Fic family protein [Bacilli bacterium]
MNIPTYEINEKIVNLVADITEKLAHLEINIDEKKDLLLRKSSKIKSVNSSCAIEANSLSEVQIISIVNGKKVIAPQNEINEVQNAYNAYTNILNYDPYKVKSFLEAHKNLTKNLQNESGVFRSGDVGVFDGNNVIHMGARPEYVSKLIKDLFNWGKESNLNPLIKSSIIHFEIEFIHPFSDGNGRIGRLWQSLILCKYNNIFEYLPIETLIYENQEAYYEVLLASEKEASSTLFIEFMLKMILQTIEKFNNDNFIKVNEDYFKGLTKTEKEVLSALIVYFNKDKLIETSRVASLLNKSKVNIRKYFAKFMKLGLLLPIGENKGRKYMLNEKIFNNKNN